MKKPLIILGLLLGAFAVPAFAQRDTIRSNKNEFSFGYGVKPSSSFRYNPRNHYYPLEEHVGAIYATYTLCLTVVHDTAFVAYDYYDPRYNPSVKMSIEPRPYFYAREVVLQSPPEDSCLLRCLVAPDKVVTVSLEKRSLYEDDYYYWNGILCRTLPLNDLATTTFTIGETTYENVHVDQGSYMVDTTNMFYAWYYSETEGLLSAKHGEHSLTLIP